MLLKIGVSVYVVMWELYAFRSSGCGQNQNSGQNHDIKTANRCFMAQFKYLGTTVTNQNLVQEEIKRMLNSGNACCHSIHNILSSRVLSKT
jgi:hypothetical protein